MSRLFFNYIMPKVQPNAGPRTLLQIKAAANQRVVIGACDIQPLGATGASAPLEFEWVRQTTDGAATLDSTNRFITSIGAAETIQTQARHIYTGEPTLGSIIEAISLHQQGNLRWVAANPFNELIVPGGDRYGLRIMASQSFSIRVVLSLEE